MTRTIIVAALIALAWGDDAAAHRAAAGHKRPLPARGPAAVPPGPPPGPGYCWHYIDRSTRTPGFWDMCRER